MSEAFMMKSYYYPKGDNPNSINGTLVIDFNSDKNQKPLQKGGAVRECSNPATSNLHLVPLNTFKAIYACLHLSAAMDYLTTAETSLLDAAATNGMHHLPVNRDNALAAAAAAAAAADANIRAGAAADRAAAAAAAVNAAARNAATARVNALAAADASVSFIVSEFINAKFRYDTATNKLIESKIKLGKILLGARVTDAAAIVAAENVGVTNNIWTTFINTISTWIANNFRNKLIYFNCSTSCIVIDIINIPMNSIQQIPVAGGGNFELQINCP